jgi:type IV pilus assembly protein PilV
MMKRQQGFTLLEVLVAIVVLAVGLIGLVGLQTVSIKNNHTAYYRAIAIQQVYDMADRMRANLAGVREGDYNSLTGAGTNTNSGCTSSVCSAAALANTDLFQWNSNNGILLPGGTGSVACAGTCPSSTQPVTEGTIFNITVSWTEHGEGTTAAATHNITESMRP